MDKQVTAKYVRIAPRKVKLITDVVRGKPVEEALNQLHFIPKKATLPVEKAIRSAVADIINEKGSSNIDTDTLFIKKIQVNKGPALARYRSRSMGRANVIEKRMSHITVVVSDEAEDL